MSAAAPEPAAGPGASYLPESEARQRLDRALHRAHATQDAGSLAALYTEAAAHMPGTDQAAFYLTHAYIFALEAGLDSAATLQARLREMGRDS